MIINRLTFILDNIYYMYLLLISYIVDRLTLTLIVKAQPKDSIN